MYRPHQPFNIPIRLLTPTAEKINGIEKKTYTAGEKIYYVGSKSFGGTDRTINGVYICEDTRILSAFYNPDFSADCMIQFCSDNSVWEIIDNIDDIELKHLYIEFKVRRYTGQI